MKIRVLGLKSRLSLLMALYLCLWREHVAVDPIYPYLEYHHSAGEGWAGGAAYISKDFGAAGNSDEVFFYMGDMIGNTGLFKFSKNPLDNSLRIENLDSHPLCTSPSTFNSKLYSL